jgi:hypothetical protein
MRRQKWWFGLAADRSSAWQIWTCTVLMFTDRISVLLLGVLLFRYTYADPDNPLGFKQTTKRNGKDIGFQTNEW